MEFLFDGTNTKNDWLGYVKDEERPFVYNPEQGLYARLRTLETWKAQSSKMIWTLFTAVVGLVSAFLVKTI